MPDKSKANLNLNLVSLTGRALEHDTSCDDGEPYDLDGNPCEVYDWCNNGYAKNEYEDTCCPGYPEDADGCCTDFDYCDNGYANDCNTDDICDPSSYDYCGNDWPNNEYYGYCCPSYPDDGYGCCTGYDYCDDGYERNC